MEIYKIGEFSQLINIAVNTLQKWDREGILIAKRTPTGRRFYTEQQYKDYMKGNCGKGSVKKNG